MCLQNDQVIAKLSQVLKAATPTNIKYLDDGSCEVTMEIKVSDLIRTTRTYMKGDTQKRKSKMTSTKEVFLKSDAAPCSPWQLLCLPLYLKVTLLL